MQNLTCQMRWRLWAILHFAFFILHLEGPRSSVRSERHRAKVEVAGASPAVDAILPLCLSSHRTSFVNSYSSVRVRPEAPIYGDHDVTAASRPVKAFVPVRIRLVTPISMGRGQLGRE